MDSVGSTTLYEVSTQPVILTRFSHVTDFKGSDQALLVIPDTYLIPLNIWERKGRRNSKRNMDSVFNCTKNTGQAFFPSLHLAMSMIRLGLGDGMCSTAL